MRKLLSILLLLISSTAYAFDWRSAVMSDGGSAAPTGIYIRGSYAAAQSTNVTSVVVTPSETALAGNVIILAVKYGTVTVNVTWPSGFAEDTTPSPGWATDAVGSYHIKTANKIAGSSEPSSYTITANDNIRAAAIIIVGNANATQPDVTRVYSAVDTSTTSPITLTLNGVASGTAGRMLIGIVGDDFTNGSSTTVTTTPAGYTPIFDTEQYLFSRNIAAFYKIDTSGTATSSPLVVLTSNPAGRTGGAMGMLLAIKPQ